MKHVAIVLIALLIPTAAMAKGECKEDKAKFCKHAAHVGACLDKHKAELSEACKATREAKANEKKNSKESAKQSGAQPLTKKDCERAGLKWNDQSNVCAS